MQGPPHDVSPVVSATRPYGALCCGVRCKAHLAIWQKCKLDADRAEALPAPSPLGLGRILALYYSLSALYQIR